MITNVSGKKIWLVGASSGIGAALACALDVAGANVALSARRTEQLQTVANKLNNSHLVLPLDVTQPEQLAQAFADIIKAWGNIDSIIFMAATYAATNAKRHDLATIKHIIDVNLMGAYNLIHTTVPTLITQRRGQLVLCSSVAGFRGLPQGQPYNCTKSALTNLAETLRIELADYQIDVKVIHPGFVTTPITAKNNFPMPCIITADAAANAIIQGLQSKNFEIHFPKRFTYLVKLLQLLPYSLYLCLMRQVMRKLRLSNTP